MTERLLRLTPALGAEELSSAIPDGVLDHPAASGSVASFEQLYAARYTPMVRLAYVLVDTREQAEEVVQEAFARLLPRYHRTADPDGYLRMSVLNGARSVLRRRRVARRHLRPLAERVDAPPGDEVLDAVRALPTAQRNAVVLRYYLDLSEAEMAETLGWKPGTVKSTLSRARDRLREVLP